MSPADSCNIGDFSSCGGNVKGCLISIQRLGFGKWRPSRLRESFVLDAKTTKRNSTKKFN
uniref:Uncharacterized protein n=1 Tax=Magallana gigas TaxID=29159 RepID=K1PR18_MAGGI